MANVMKISFKKDEEDLLTHLESQSNKSVYVKQLIKSDIDGLTTVDKETFSQILDIILKLKDGAQIVSKDGVAETIKPEVTSKVINGFKSFIK